MNSTQDTCLRCLRCLPLDRGGIRGARLGGTSLNLTPLKVEEEIGSDYVELVSYYVNKCQTKNAAFCSMFAAHLNKAAEHYQQVTTLISMIMRLYAAERKQLVAEKDGASAMTVLLSIVMDAFHLLCHIILSCLSITSKRDGNRLDEDCKTVLNVAVVAFTLSIKTKLDIQLIRYIRIDMWHGALCSRKTNNWLQRFEAYAVKCHGSILNVIAANDLFERLLAPIPVVKQWLKMECKCVQQVNETDGSLTLYCLLSSSTEISMRNIGIILKQELVAYVMRKGVLLSKILSPNANENHSYPPARFICESRKFF
ncbi:separase isoform X1 [Senna tora]|uniref:Separase isoform X1 n=1 Tax=Senna tora TaxID=362788 RepID=A0A834W182_9FABA|nr:separase isoform X1 [Senna tora]